MRASKGYLVHMQRALQPACVPAASLLTRLHLISCVQPDTRTLLVPSQLRHLPHLPSRPGPTSALP